jgi:hypothetical protein
MISEKPLDLLDMTQPGFVFIQGFDAIIVPVLEYAPGSEVLDLIH